MLLLLGTLLTACSGRGSEASAQEDTSAAGEESSASGEGLSKSMRTAPDTGAFEAAAEEAMTPAIMVDGTLYFDTGYNSSVGRCGVLDGEISGTVPATQLPVEDNQTNFEGAEGWQMGFEAGTIDVYMNNRFRIFAAEGTFAEGEIPAGVGNMMGVITSIRGDGYFGFRPTSVPEAFSHMGTEEEYLVPVSAMEDDPAFPKKEGEVNWSLVEGGVVLVYCDSLVQEVSPPVIENVYHVFRMGSSPAQIVGTQDKVKLDDLLRGLDWQDETCDGLPEYSYQAADGTTYQINLSGSQCWIWKEWKQEVMFTEDDELYTALMAHLNTYGFEEAVY
ncbi:MAG: hypothetical protein IJQ21_06080 [Lachnospiraceae bacterium]|nr:hypothetical protein [Lachnospiraceae bacterium]